MSARGLYLAVAGFLAGVCARSFFPVGLPLAAWCALLALAVLVLMQLGAVRRAVASAMAISMIACALGVLRMDRAIVMADPVLAARVGSEALIEGVVVSDTDARDAATRVTVRAVRVDGTQTSLGTNLLVVLPPFSKAGIGDHVQVVGMLARPERFDTETGRTFDYPGYLAARRTVLVLERAQLQHVEEGGGFRRALSDVRSAYIAGTQAILPEPHAGLASGIIAGDTRSVGAEVSDQFALASLTHMLVLSGYNITVVTVGVLWIFSRFHPAVRVGFASGTVTLFVLAAGLSGSAVRAAIMALIGMLATFTRRQFIAARSLALASGVMVAWNPYLLVFDPGFQLSVLATAGLIAFADPLARALKVVPTTGSLREVVATTIAAQVSVLPLLLWQSGTLSIVALPANVLALPAVPWAMLASFVASLASLVLGDIAIPLALPGYLLLSYILGVAKVFSAIPGAAVALPPFSAALLVPAYALIGLLAYYVHTKAAVPKGRLPDAPRVRD
ncbi:ComEC/Rec2 family competence protein [Candidatus Kaiserbacteria bacterium]|nr:ComEC/Rec2 family competence protein [Candidatus Kaiserbacteria bacterium]